MQYQNINYIHFDTIESTNGWAKEHAAALNPLQLTCITAELQTAGRGRFGRTWLCPPGNLAATLFFCLPLNSSILPNTAQLMCLSCAKVLIERGFKPQIKWPNDLLLGGEEGGWDFGGGCDPARPNWPRSWSWNEY